jgi:hypothetical protein
MGFIGKAWRGEQRCWIVYWLYGNLASIGWMVLFTLMKGLPPVTMLGGFAVYVVYAVWLVVSQWRCAFNLDWKFWGYVVRFITALIPVMFVGGVVMGIIMGMHTGMCRALADHTEMRATHMEQYEECVKQSQSAQPAPQGGGSAH